VIVAMPAERPATGTADRNRRIFEMRLDGASYGMVAAEFGLTKQRAHQIVLAELERLRRGTDALDAAEAAGRAELAELLEERRILYGRIRAVRARLVVLAEEREALRIDRLLGLVG